MPKTEEIVKFKMDVDGMTLACQLSAPPGTPTEHIQEKILQLERYMSNPDQIRMDFDIQTMFTGVSLRADKPEKGDKKFSFGIDVTGAPLVDRATIYNYAQTGVKVTIKVVEVEPGTNRAVEEKPVEAEPAKPTTMLLEGLGEGDGKVVTINSIEERLHAALRMKPGADLRWGQRRAGQSDNELRAAIITEFNKGKKDPVDDWTADNQDRCHFVAVVKAGEPKFYLAPQPGMTPKVNSKPTLQGAELIEAVRKLMEIPKPEPKRLKGIRAVSGAAEVN